MMWRRLMAMVLIGLFIFAPIALAGSDTTYLDIYKPAVGELDWGEEVNANWDLIDRALGSEHTLNGTHYNLGILDTVPSGIELYVRGSAGISQDLTVGGTTTISSDLTISGATSGIYAPKINDVIIVDGNNYAKTNAGIQLAIDALPSTGGKVFLPAGTYAISGGITISKANTVLEGVGSATVLDVANSTNADIITISGSSTLDWELRKFKINGNKDNNTSGSGIHITSAIATDARAKIEDLYIYQMKEHGIEIDDVDVREIYLKDIYVSDCDDDGFRMQGSDHKIVNCIAGSNDKHGFNLSDGNSQYVNCKAFGSGVDSSDPNYYYGFYIADVRIQLVNCQAQDNYTDGIYIGAGESLVVGCQGDSNHREGTVAGTYAGIRITTDGDDSNISSNICFDRNATNKQDYGIIVDSGVTNCTLAGNVLEDNLTGELSIGSTEIRNNALFNEDVGFSGDLTLSGATAAIFGDSDNDIRLDAATARGVNLQIETSEPLNVDLTFSGTNSYLESRYYMDDNFEDDEVLPLSFGNETELLTNPGAEGTYENEGSQLDVAPNWTADGADAGVDTLSEETTTVHGGSSAQHCLVDALAEGVRVDGVATTQNSYYRASGWVYIPSSGTGGTVKLIAKEGGGDFTEYANVSTATQDDWIFLSVDFQDIDTTATTRVQFLSSGGGAEWYVDDASLTLITLTSGFGTVSCDDEHATFSWEEDGSTQVDGSTNVANSDADGNLCVYDGGYTPYIKNRLGAGNHKMRATTWFK